MKNFLNKIINKGLGRTNFVPKFVRFTIIRPDSKCFKFIKINFGRKNFDTKFFRVICDGQINLCKSLNRFCAFTLSEMLITIVIIGIVAAMTIPVLNKSIKQFQVSTALPKMYSELRNAARMYQSENGIDIQDFDTSLSARDFLDTYFLPYFKGAIPCNSKQECWSGGNLPKMLDKKTDVYIKAGLILMDGRIIACTPGLGSIVFFIDVDGKKGDNISGHDIFNFYLFSTIAKKNELCSRVSSLNNGLFPGGLGYGCYPMKGYTIQQLMTYYSTNSLGIPLDRPCTKNTNQMGGGQSAGNACAVMLYQNNWKFPKGYPW